MDKENTLYIDLKDGRVVIEMRPDLAPKHVAQIKKLAREGKYDGIVFHRVIDGFMAQTGDPDGTGMGGMGERLPAEFSKAPHLNGQYTVFGKVVAGMELVDNIKKGAQSDNGTVTDPDKIISAKIEYK